MRKRLRLTVIIVVIALLGGVGVLVGHSLWQQRKQDVMQAGLEFLPGVAQHIQDFHRVKVQDGHKIWEVSADDAQYLEDEKTIVVRGAMMQLFLKDGHALGLKGAGAWISLDAREVSRVDLRGDIQMTFGDYVIRTEQATYDHGQQTVSAPGAVEISSEALQLHGDSMEVDVPAQRVRLLHKVSMRLQPALLNQGGGNAPL